MSWLDYVETISSGEFLGEITRHRLLRLATIVATVLMAGLWACGDGPATDVGGHGDGDSLYPKLPKVTGHIDGVVANPENPRHFLVLEITDVAGKRWRFSSDGWVGVSVGHLKDHQIQGTTVTVWYEELSGDDKVARFVGD